jgi:hypothetical protein
MWIKLEDKISLDVGEDNFFANELPEKICNHYGTLSALIKVGYYH